MIVFDELPDWPQFPDLYIYEWSTLGLAVVGLYALIVAKTRLTAIVSLGIQGFAVALIFLLFGAPDLSFTTVHGRDAGRGHHCSHHEPSFFERA